MAARDDRRLVKLVRDDVEKFCGGDMAVRYEPIPEAEFVWELRKKLVEESVEYLSEPTVEELADVWEVVQALAEGHGGMAAVERAAERKREHKGGFDGRLGMYLHVAPEHRA